MSAVSPKSLLIVEDNSDDLFFIQRLLRQIGKLELAEAVRDGESAIEYLQQRLSEPPRLVLLDLKLPRAHGFQVLEWIRSQPQLNETVVTILSSSPERRDIARPVHHTDRKIVRARSASRIPGPSQQGVGATVLSVLQFSARTADGSKKSTPMAPAATADWLRQLACRKAV